MLGCLYGHTKHGEQRIYKWHIGNHHAEKLRRHVHYCSHQQTSSRNSWKLKERKNKRSIKKSHERKYCVYVIVLASHLNIGSSIPLMASLSGHVHFSRIRYCALSMKSAYKRTISKKKKKKMKIKPTKNRHKMTSTLNRGTMRKCQPLFTPFKWWLVSHLLYHWRCSSCAWACPARAMRSPFRRHRARAQKRTQSHLKQC